MIAIASDHGGYRLKELIKKHLEERGDEYRDFGCHGLDSCDYPDYAGPAALAVASGECEKGIVVCTTGIGVSIIANKVKGIRCALCTDGAGVIGENVAMDVVDTFLDTAFSGLEKHARRIGKIAAMESHE